MMPMIFKINNLLAVANCPLDSTDPKCDTLLPMVAANEATIKIILQIFFGIIGAVAVFYIVIAGFQLVTSQGDSQSMAKARQTIIYASVGLAVVLLAEAVVTFVVGNI